MKKALFILLLASLQIALSAKQFNFEFSSYNLSSKNGYQVVDVENTFYADMPGEPLLPIKTVFIVVPFAKDVSDIQCRADEVILDKKYDIMPSAENYPTMESDISAPKKGDIYQKNALYPIKKFKKIGVQRKNGVDVLIVNLYPFQYNPVSKTLVHNKDIHLDVKFKDNPSKKDAQIKKLLKYDRLEHIFSDKKFINKEDLVSYKGQSQTFKNSRSSLVSSSNPNDYIIITNNALSTEWDSLVVQKENSGLNTEIYTTEDIFSNYSGADNAAKLRNFIIDAYDTWSGTTHPLQWVLLGGDSNVITARAVTCYAYWSSAWNGRTFYTDNYYAGLDGDWDNDADGIYGEGDDAQKPDDFTTELGTAGEEADWFFDVNVGRASLENSAEIANWLHKTLNYENLNVTESYLKTSTLVGEYLGYGAYGATVQDEIAMYLPQFNHNKLYQLNGTYSKTNVVNAINNGTNIVSHIGHGSYLKVFDIYDGDVDTLLTNTDYCLVYTQACYTGLYYGHNCIAESFIEKEHGAFAYIGNSHYGFYSSYEDQGASQLFEREFFDAISNENIKQIGKANLDSKEDLIGIIGAVGAKRWVGMDLTLFGDPNISLHTDIGDVSVSQTAGDELTITYNDTPGSGADNLNNYSVYERDDETASIAVTNCLLNGNTVVLTLDSNLREGIPYNLQISNVSGIVNPTIRPIDTICNIIELSIIKPTVWTAENGPYYLYENLIINKSNLTIEPGAVLKFNSEKGVIAFDGGWLNAVGTPNNKIVFTSYNDSTSAQNGDWAEIFFYRDADHDNCILDNCIIEYATTGVYIDSTSTATIKNTTITNTMENGIYSYYASPTIENVSVAFANGSADANGFYFEDSNPSIHNIVAYNNANYGFCAVDNSTIYLENSIIYGNSTGEILNTSSVLDITYSDVSGGYSGIGNIDVNPLFVASSSGDFSLQPFSLCIDAGDPASSADLDGTTADIGAIAYYQEDTISQPNNITITKDEFIELNWDTSEGAIFYNIYSSDEPNSSFNLLAGEVRTLSWTDSLSSDKKFYQVKGANNR